MWASAQHDGRPPEYSWRPLFNAVYRAIISVSAIEAIYLGQAVSQKGDDFTTAAWNYCVDEKCNDITLLAALAAGW